MRNSYPIIANCNYESADSAADAMIHEARKAVEAGLTQDDDLIEALDALKSKLGIDPEVFKTALNIKHKDKSVKKIKAEELFDSYTAELEKIVNAVDKETV